ncbi:MAG: DUF86 domain-containing protein [Chitinophagaceae bacterium]
MSSHDSQLLVSDILSSAKKILDYTIDLSFEQFMNDGKTMDAVVRNFEIIGEAANRLSEDFKDQYPEIDWHRIRGFRNRIVHDYMGVDFSIVWQIKVRFLPLLIDQLTKLG